MANTEVDRLIDDSLNHAKNNFEYTQWLKDIDEACRKFDNPALIQNKAEAIFVCDCILKWCENSGAIPKGTILHRLGMRLIDYLRRCDP